MNPSLEHTTAAFRGSEVVEDFLFSGAAKLGRKASAVREKIEAAFLAIAEVLPTIGRDVEELASRLGELLDPSHSNAVVETLARTCAAAKGFASAINTTAARDRAVCHTASVIAERGAAISGQLGGVNRPAYDLRRTGLNASIAAVAKSAARGSSSGPMPPGSKPTAKPSGLRSQPLSNCWVAKPSE